MLDFILALLQIKFRLLLELLQIFFGQCQKPVVILCQRIRR
jgi:hypothetical protein